MNARVPVELDVLADELRELVGREEVDRVVEYVEDMLVADDSEGVAQLVPVDLRRRCRPLRPSAAGCSLVAATHADRDKAIVVAVIDPRDANRDTEHFRLER